MKKPTKKLIIYSVIALLFTVLCSAFLFTSKRTLPRCEKSEAATTVGEIHQYFPQSYWRDLEALLKAHPNWEFVAAYTGVHWEECFTAETELMLKRNLTAVNSNGTLAYPEAWYSKTIPGAYNAEAKTWVPFDSGKWYQSSEEAIRFCMDPRNFLTEEGGNIFMFMDSSTGFSGQYQEAAQYLVESILERTGVSHWTKPGVAIDLYAEKTVEGENGPVTVKKYLTYAEAIVQICRELDLNPFVVASRLMQEHGSAQSELISGTRAFRDQKSGQQINGGYYNYFNIGAGGNSLSQIYENGLNEAYENGWDTRYKALYGGAEKYKRIYMEGGQVTPYFQKFNVMADSPRQFWGQYMQNLTAPQSESLMLYNSLRRYAAQNMKFTFLIPVYLDMPAKKTPAPK